MLEGSVFTLVSLSPEEAAGLAEKHGKRKEPGKYYRKEGEELRAILVPDAGDLMALASAVSVSDGFCFISRELNRSEAEILLLLEASGRPGCVSSPDPEGLSRALRGMSVAGRVIGSGNEAFEFRRARNLGIGVIDEAFVVKGVGPVIVGFSFSAFSVHQRVRLVPSLKEAEIKSIQVLDEDFGEIGPGVRFGFALRGVEEKDVKSSYALLADGPVALSTRAEAVKFGLSPEASALHAFIRGIKAFGRVEGSSVELNSPLPRIDDGVIFINLNAPAGKPRIYGSGRMI